MDKKAVGNQQSSCGGSQCGFQVAAPEAGGALSPAGRPLPAGGPDEGARPPGQGHQVTGRTSDEVGFLLPLELAWQGSVTVLLFDASCRGLGWRGRGTWEWLHRGLEAAPMDVLSSTGELK